MKCLPIAAALVTLSASSTLALPGFGTGAPAASATPAAASTHQHYRKAMAIKALRAEGLELRATDGGTLSEAHRAALQAKLNHILAGNY